MSLCPDLDNSSAVEAGPAHLRFPWRKRADGRLLVRRGKVLTMNEKGILKRGARATNRLYDRAGIKIPIAWQVE